MNVPLLFQEKMLAGLDYQIQVAVKSPQQTTVDSRVISLCVAPWEMPGLFNLPTGDPTSVIDRYELRAVCFGHYYVSDAPTHDDWKVDIEDNIAIPMFSPLDVWKAQQRHSNGDTGVEPPPLTCDVDRLLRNIKRGYEAPVYHVTQLATNAHDLDVLAAALKGKGFSVEGSLEELITERRLWRTRTDLEGSVAGDYLERYSETPLAVLRKILSGGMFGRDDVVAKWVSPTIIEVIESAEHFRDRISSPRWLLYKAVTIHHGLLPEDQHNRMIAEATTGDTYAKAYFEFLKPLPASGKYATPDPHRDFLRQLGIA